LLNSFKPFQRTPRFDSFNWKIPPQLSGHHESSALHHRLLLDTYEHQRSYDHQAQKNRADCERK
jgi:hypothetical protein